MLGALTASTALPFGLVPGYPPTAGEVPEHPTNPKGAPIVKANRRIRGGTQVMLTRMALDYEPPSMSLTPALVRQAPTDVTYGIQPHPRTWWKHLGPFHVGRNYSIPPDTGITVTRHFAEVSVHGYTLSFVWR